MRKLILVLMVGGLVALPGGARAFTSAGQEGMSAPRQAQADDGIPVTLQVPLFSERFEAVPVAVVNEEAITLKDLVDSLAAMHGSRADDESGGRTDFSRALTRLINTQLIVLEARTMGMDELEEVKAFLQDRADSTMRMQLQKQVADGVTADEQQVERYYRDLIREYSMRSLMFEQEKDAKALVKAVVGGGDYEALAAEAIGKGKARGQLVPEVVKGTDLLPEIKKAVDAMRPGGLSKPIPIKPGYVVFRLDAVREVERPGAREEARQRGLALAQGAALVEHNKKLSKKYLTVNEKLAGSLELDPRKMEALLKDTRVIARIKGEAPVTVGDLARAIEEKLYHGSGTSTKQKMNRRKLDALEQVLAKRVLLAEAKRVGIDKTDEYRKIMKAQETSLLFGLFVERVVKPEVKLRHEEVQAYYEQHRNEYLAASRVKLDGLLFENAGDAEKALASLQQGTDLGWLRENAAGLADPGAPGHVAIPADYVLATALPPSFRSAISGAVPGELRIAAGEGPFSYLLIVQDVREPEPLPLEEVKGEIEQKVYREKIDAAVDAWGDKLRPSYDVHVYLRGKEQGSLADPATSTMVRKSDGLH